MTLEISQLIMKMKGSKELIEKGTFYNEEIREAKLLKDFNISTEKTENEEILVSV